MLSAAAVALAAPSFAQAATFLTVGPDSLCGQGGCFVGGKKSYTQTFSAAGQSGEVNISQLQVMKDIVGSVEHTAVKVTFVLADGTEVSWGKFSLMALGGDVVTLGGQAINWNTLAGDLTVRLDLVVPEKGGLGGGGGGWGFGGGGGGGGGFEAGDGRASFDDLPVGRPIIRPSIPDQNAIAAIPEPATWAMMILGFGAAGGLLRRQRAYHLKYG